MPTAFPQTPLTPFDERLIHHLRVVASAVYRTAGRLSLYLLVVSIVVVIVATAMAQVKLNAWNQPFYDAIERKALPEFLHQLTVFFTIAGVLLVLNVCQTGINQLIRLKFRKMATGDLIEGWMSQKRAARISRAGEIGVNPDQRIHADTQHLADLTTDLGVGLLQASILLLSFIGVLWVLSRGVVLSFDGRDLVIPGYMVWAALIYAASGSWLSWRVGRPLVRLGASRYAREAQLRFGLVRGAEHADGIALNDGEADERRRLGRDLDSVLDVQRQIVRATVRLTWVTAGYGWVALIFPIVVAAPGYFSGHLSFGALMMVVGAFNQVQQALRWFVDNTGAIADWRATFARVMTFRQAMLDLDRIEAGVERIERIEHADGQLTFDDLEIISYHGHIELSEPHVAIDPGERVLISGRPAAGKSTLFLAIAGLWNCGTGRISLPPAGEMMFLSQRPFVPQGSLRAALSYSRPGQRRDDAELKAALERVGLTRLAGALDRVERWDAELSLGEQERLTYARLLLNRPKWVVCDEGLDPADDTNRDLILSIFTTELAGSAVISIANSTSPDGFYSRVIRLVAHPSEARPDSADTSQRAAPCLEDMQAAV